MTKPFDNMNINLLSILFIFSNDRDAAQNEEIVIGDAKNKPLVMKEKKIDPDIKYAARDGRVFRDDSGYAYEDNFRV